MDLSIAHLVHMALVLGLAAQTNAYWVLGCGKPVAVERLDPIVSPKNISSHAHSIMGGNAFDWDLDYNKTQTSTCTTCGVSKDLSNYWVPKVYFHAGNGSYISVEQIGGVNVYYQSATSSSFAMISLTSNHTDSAWTGPRRKHARRSSPSLPASACSPATPTAAPTTPA